MVVLTTLMQRMPPAILPPGVHVLSAESQAALARAKAEGDAIAARHAKPERLAAATIGKMDPERYT
ncbi:hypothetical protein HAP47_0022435 [Bradyrhizobium sp. 41S5]|uniref:hypothetical protein n=1 Tax=Bradyrhizobium sp. 41S5 TaxID=1404443 RepID=UPI00156B64AD|nr:hypothetical protein [Bradyrhizobium sp. 41S5]UFX42029.1 hypothetical protein HAP47_0022435 [Bradyrhizobium sp. 41S5]